MQFDSLILIHLIVIYLNCTLSFAKLTRASFSYFM